MPIVNKSFSDIITFTRSTGGGRFSASGQYEWLPANTPRIDYDPVTGECRGLLVEEQRTNVVMSSTLESTSHRSGGGDITWGADTGVAGPLAKGARVGPVGAALNYAYQQGFAPTPGTTYAFSIFVRFADGRPLEFGNLAAENSPLNPFGVVINNNAFAPKDLVVIDCGNGTYRISANTTPSESIIRGWGVLVRPTHKPGMPDLFVTGCQIEAGAFPTSYIPTTDAQVTRAADIASVNELSPWFRADEGTLLLDMVTVGDRAAGGTFALSVGTSGSEYLGLAYMSASTYQRGSYAAAGGATSSSVLPPGASAAGDRVKIAASYAADGTISTAADGAFLGSKTLTSGRAPRFASMYIGRGHFGGAAVNCRIRSIRYFPRRLSDAELQALTA